MKRIPLPDVRRIDPATHFDQNGQIIQTSLLDYPEIDEREVLHLSLKQEPFEVMVTGEKCLEVREDSSWIRARLHNRMYTHVKFINGYGANRPFFIVEYFGFYRAANSDSFKYSNGLEVSIKPGDYVITLGDVVEVGNYSFLKK